MPAWRSRPEGNRQTLWLDWALPAVLVWLAPLPIGGVVVLANYLLSMAFGLATSGEAAHPLAVTFFLGYVLFFSPMLSWAGVLVALAPAWVLLRLGLGGWASFMFVGLMAGAMAGSFFQGFHFAASAAYGMFAALAFRWLMMRRNPAIFTGG